MCVALGFVIRALGAGAATGIAAVAEQGPALVALFAVASLPLMWLRLRFPHPELTVSGHPRSGLPWTAAVAFLGLAARAALRWFAAAAVVGAAAVVLGTLRQPLDQVMPLPFLTAAWLVAAALSARRAPEVSHVR
jgi:hypothetical protein